MLVVILLYGNSKINHLVKKSYQEKKVKKNIVKMFMCVFTGESVDDYGGGYSESIAEICEELQNGSLPILIQTPNGREDTGTSRDCFLLNPSATTKVHMKMFEFLGM